MLRLDLCLLFSGRRDLRVCRKKLQSRSSALASRHQIHISIISGILMLLQFTAHRMQLPKLLLGEKAVLVSLFNYDIIYW